MADFTEDDDIQDAAATVFEVIKLLLERGMIVEVPTGWRLTPLGDEVLELADATLH